MFRKTLKIPKKKKKINAVFCFYFCTNSKCGKYGLRGYSHLEVKKSSEGRPQRRVWRLSEIILLTIILNLKIK